MFDRVKKGSGSESPIAMQPPAPPPDPRPLLTELKKQREEWLAKIQALEANVNNIDVNIVWLERHPEADSIIDTLSHRLFGSAANRTRLG